MHELAFLAAVSNEVPWEEAGIGWGPHATAHPFLPLLPRGEERCYRTSSLRSSPWADWATSSCWQPEKRRRGSSHSLKFTYIPRGGKDKHLGHLPPSFLPARPRTEQNRRIVLVGKALRIAVLQLPWNSWEETSALYISSPPFLMTTFISLHTARNQVRQSVSSPSLSNQIFASIQMRLDPWLPSVLSQAHLLVQNHHLWFYVESPSQDYNQSDAQSI